MKAIIGLGNPEEQHEKTRHNVGFRVVEKLAAQLGAAWENSDKLFSQLAKTDQAVLVKPQTYMNDSGRAVQAVTHFFKIPVAALLVIHDDLDIPLGTMKFQQGSGPKAHNGLLSIYEALGTKDFWHVRIGVDNRAGEKTMPGSAYVLSPFSSEEEQALDRVIDQAVEKIVPFLQTPES